MLEDALQAHRPLGAAVRKMSSGKLVPGELCPTLAIALRCFASIRSCRDERVRVLPALIRAAKPLPPRLKGGLRSHCSVYLGSMGGFRWRTALRTRLPHRPPLYLLVTKGRDCADHDWYRSTGSTWHCYHCRVVEVRD
jgi:hypothetical protein